MVAARRHSIPRQQPPLAVGPSRGSANRYHTSVPTAETLRNQVVLVPALAALTDLTNGPGAAQPQRDGTVIEYVDDPASCQPLVQEDTEGTPACDEAGGGGGSGLDESGGADDSSEGSMFGSVGDDDALVR